MIIIAQAKDFKWGVILSMVTEKHSYDEEVHRVILTFCLHLKIE